MYNEINFYDLMFCEKYYKYNKNFYYMYICNCGMYKRELVFKLLKKIIFFYLSLF